MTGSVSNILPFQTYFYLESPDSRSWVKKHNEIKKKSRTEIANQQETEEHSITLGGKGGSILPADCEL